VYSDIKDITLLLNYRRKNNVEQLLNIAMGLSVKAELNSVTLVIPFPKYN
jgi:hypothetical protein